VFDLLYLGLHLLLDLAKFFLRLVLMLQSGGFALLLVQELLDAFFLLSFFLNEFVQVLQVQLGLEGFFFLQQLLLEELVLGLVRGHALDLVDGVLDAFLFCLLFLLLLFLVVVFHCLGGHLFQVLP